MISLISHICIWICNMHICMHISIYNFVSDTCDVPKAYPLYLSIIHKPCSLLCIHAFAAADVLPKWLTLYAGKYERNSNVNILVWSPHVFAHFAAMVLWLVWCYDNLMTTNWVRTDCCIKIVSVISVVVCALTTLIPRQQWLLCGCDAPIWAHNNVLQWEILLIW